MLEVGGGGERELEEWIFGYGKSQGSQEKSKRRIFCRFFFFFFFWGAASGKGSSAGKADLHT